MREMKILVVGNLANLGFELTKSLRNFGINAWLLMPKNPSASEDPSSIFPEFKEKGYPEWIIFFDKNERKFNMKNWKIQVINEMREKSYEGIIALTEFSIFAMFSGKPYAASSTGNDMRELAFEKSIKGFLLRLSYKKAKLVIWGEPYKKPLLKTLKIEKKAVFATTPRTVIFNSENNLTFEQKLNHNLKNKFVIFHPTAQDWNYKNNRIFLEAFVEICKNHSDVFLILSERGPNIEEAKKILISSPDTKNKYEFMPWLNFEELQAFSKKSDLIADQFGVGSFGMITVENMFLGKPIMLRINEKLFNEFYPKKPVGLLNVDNKEKIVSYIEKLIQDKDFCKKCCEENKKWVNQNWNNEILTKKWIEICKKIIT